MATRLEELSREYKEWKKKNPIAGIDGGYGLSLHLQITPSFDGDENRFVLQRIDGRREGVISLSVDEAKALHAFLGSMLAERGPKEAT